MVLSIFLKPLNEIKIYYAAMILYEWKVNLNAQIFHLNVAENANVGFSQRVKYTLPLHLAFYWYYLIDQLQKKKEVLGSFFVLTLRYIFCNCEPIT